MVARVPIVDYLVLGDEPHLVANQCVDCGARFFDRRNACASCSGTSFEQVPIGTDGELKAFTIVSFAAPGVPVPFVAGVAEMSYPAFALYNVTGAIAWVGICVGAGYVFGNVPIVKENFSLVALGIVFVSILPMVFEYLKYRRART